MDDDDNELRNPFPSPPSHYTNYTTHNLNLFKLLKERAGEETVDEHHLLADQSNLPPWSLTQLEKPRVDWILEDGQYTVFGDTWFTKETIPSLAELGGHQLYPADPSTDRRPALLAILRSMLLTYSKLTGSLLLPPQTTAASAPSDWQRHVEWITVLAQNIMAAANDLRPVQARGNLELMMKRQLELRREETKILHTKCDLLEAKLAELRASAQQISASQPKTETVPPTAPPRTMDATPAIGVEDVLRWAEEV